MPLNHICNINVLRILKYNTTFLLNRCNANPSGILRIHVNRHSQVGLFIKFWIIRCLLSPSLGKLLFLSIPMLAAVGQIAVVV